MKYIKRHSKNCLLSLMIVALLMYCDNKRTETRSGYGIDPVVEAFHGSNVKYMLSSRYAKYADTTFVDTTTLDRNGNIIKVQEFGRIWQQKAYDSLYRVVRAIQYFEVEQFAMSYDTVGTIVTETDVRISGAWEDETPEIWPGKGYNVVYHLDKFGRVQEVVDELRNATTTFIYDNENLQEKKQVIHTSDEQFSPQMHKWKYYYSGSKLTKVENFYNDSIQSIQYFGENGLPNFTCNLYDPSNRQDTVKHRYIYY